METHNLNRKLLGSRKGHVKTFLAWLEENGAVIEGVEIVDFGEPEGENMWTFHNQDSQN